MKKLILLLFALILSGCAIETRDFYDLDENARDAIIEQLKKDLAKQLRIEYHPDITEIENMIVNVVEHNERAIIGVTNYTKVGLDKYAPASTGSGFIYEYNPENNYYYAITNAHVVENADKIKVLLYNGELLEVSEFVEHSKIYLADQESDIAVIRFQHEGELKVIKFVEDSDTLKRGQLAIAIGNPLGFDYFASVTLGVISGLGRDIDIDYNDDGTIDWTASLIQHDAAISPGNSGGPLFDINGRVIGVNNMKIVDKDVSNIGFAIPANTAIKIAQILREKGVVERAALGVTVLLNQHGDNSGVTVHTVLKDGAAGKAGIQPGDVIIRIGEYEIKNDTDLRFALNNSYVGETVKVTVKRGDDELTFDVTLQKK